MPHGCHVVLWILLIRHSSAYFYLMNSKTSHKCVIYFHVWGSCIGPNVVCWTAEYQVLRSSTTWFICTCVRSMLHPFIQSLFQGDPLHGWFSYTCYKWGLRPGMSLCFIPMSACWYYDMEIFSILLSLCEWSPVGSPHKEARNVELWCFLWC